MCPVVVFLVATLLSLAGPAVAMAPIDSLAALGAGDTLVAVETPAVGDTLALMLIADPPVALGGDGHGQVIEPAGVAVDAFGRVYITDAALHRLQRFDRNGRFLGENGVLGSGNGEMRRPGSVAMLGVLSVGVLDRENRRVEAFDLFGRRVGTALDLADPALEETVGRVDPTQLATDRGGVLYVADPARERVLAFDVSGRFVRALGGFGTRPGQLRGLRGLATAPRGELIVTERLNARLQRLDAGGRVAASWSLPIRPGGGAEALPAATDAGGRVAVADEASGTLWMFDAGGMLLAEARGSGHPRALAFAPDSTLVVAVAGPPEVRRYRLVGRRDRAPRAGR